MSDDHDERMQKLVTALTDRLGRVPTEDEVYLFVFGNDTTRTAIWNSKETN